MNDLYIRAAKLYDDSYKEDDKARLIKEHGFTEKEADDICKWFAEMDDEDDIELHHREMTREEIRDTAGCLYDGGWRSEDKDDLIYEYKLTTDQADYLCECLAEIEEEIKKEKEGELL